MAVAILGFRQAVIRQFPSYIRSGMSARAVYNTLRERHGHVYTYQVFMNDFRNAKAAFDFKPLWKQLDPTAKVARELFAPTNLPLKEKFLYPVEARVFNRLTNEWEVKRFAFTHGKRLSPADIQQRARGIIIADEFQQDPSYPQYIAVDWINVMPGYEQTAAPIGGRRARRSHAEETIQAE